MTDQVLVPHDEPQHSGAVVAVYRGVEFPDLYGDSLLAEMLVRDTDCGHYRMLNVDQADRRILLEKLADAYRELDQALTESERSDA